MRVERIRSNNFVFDMTLSGYVETGNYIADMDNLMTYVAARFSRTVLQRVSLLLVRDSDNCRNYLLKDRLGGEVGPISLDDFTSRKSYFLPLT